MGLVSVYEAEFEFRSLMAWGKKLFLSLSVFAIMLLKRLPDGSKQKRWLPGFGAVSDICIVKMQDKNSATLSCKSMISL